MKKLKLLFAGVATIASAAAAKAADVVHPRVFKAPPAAAPMPAFSWTACHVGIHGGGAWGRQTVDARSSGAIIATTDVQTNGALFGGQVGCDLEFAGGWIVGLEGDVAATDLEGSFPDPFFPGNPASTRIDAQWLASVTGRLGYSGLFPGTMVYFKGGGAWIREEYNITSNVTGINGEFNKTHSGWTVGGGIAWAVFGSWSFFVEYNHYDFRRSEFSIYAPGTSPPIGFEFKGPRIDAVKVGLDFRFGGRP